MADTTIISSQTTIEGTLSGDGSVEVEGRIIGPIRLGDTLTVQPGGYIEGAIEAREIIIHGEARGALTARERLILSPSARVVATLSAPTLGMQDGAQLSGEVDMALDAPAATTPTTRSAPVATSSPRIARPAPAAPATAPAPRAPARPAASPAPQTTTTTTVVVEEEEELVQTQEPEKEDVLLEELAVDEETLEGLEEQTVKELREELRRLDLPVSGSKSELIERLIQHQPQDS